MANLYVLRFKAARLALQGDEIVMAGQQDPSVFTLQYPHKRGSRGYLDSRIIDDKIFMSDNFYFTVKHKYLCVHTPEGLQRVHYSPEFKKLVCCYDSGTIYPVIAEPVNQYMWNTVKNVTNTYRVQYYSSQRDDVTIPTPDMSERTPTPLLGYQPKTTGRSAVSSGSQADLGDQTVSSQCSRDKRYRVDVWTLDPVIRSEDKWMSLHTSNTAFNWNVQSDPVLKHLYWSSDDVTNPPETGITQLFNLKNCPRVFMFANLVLCHLQHMTHKQGEFSCIPDFDSPQMSFYYRLPFRCLIEDTWRVIVGDTSFNFRVIYDPEV